MKRIFDTIISIALIITLSPLMFLVACAIFINLGRPILFKQERPGLYGKPFIIYKFRTMMNEKNKNGELLPDSERMSIFGEIIRRYSLDEIPQLINVIKGNLSLVGPRPLLMEYLELYATEQAKRHNVRPGITGWAQVNGRNALTWDERFKLDVWYVDNQSFILDMKILCLTLLRVVQGNDVSHAGHVTMEKFKGNTGE
jgi:sugar transferase EpsL